MHKKFLYILFVVFFVTSCASLDEVGRGLTGAKKDTSDEFFIKKKDPLILPPDYENLPTPDDRIAAGEEISFFENTLGTSIEDASSESGSVEDSILKKIRQK